MNYTLTLNFVIDGELIYLSHRQTLTMLCRGLSRAGVDAAYTCGFNPHPCIFLPLPRSVGVEAENELSYAYLSSRPIETETELGDIISAQLPAGCRLIKADVQPGKIKYSPLSARYTFTLAGVDALCQVRDIPAEIETLKKTGQRLIIERVRPGEKSDKTVDILPFIKSASLDRQSISFDCAVTPQGSVRVDELMKLLGVDRRGLAGPVVRKSVEWQVN